MCSGLRVGLPKLVPAFGHDFPSLPPCNSCPLFLKFKYISGNHHHHQSNHFQTPLSLLNRHSTRTCSRMSAYRSETRLSPSCQPAQPTLLASITSPKDNPHIYQTSFFDHLTMSKAIISPSVLAVSVRSISTSTLPSSLTHPNSPISVISRRNVNE